MTKMHMEWAARHVKLDTDTEYQQVLAIHFAAMFAHFNPASTAAASW